MLCFLDDGVGMEPSKFVDLLFLRISLSLLIPICLDVSRGSNRRGRVWQIAEKVRRLQFDRSVRQRSQIVIISLFLFLFAFISTFCFNFTF
jgi:hypothetical protein